MAHLYHHTVQGRTEEGTWPSLLGPLWGMESDQIVAKTPLFHAELLAPHLST